MLFFLPALNLAGIPPFSGFLGKLGLVQAGVDDGGPLAWTLVAGGLLTSLLTLYAIARVWNLAFWRAPHPDMPDAGDTVRAARTEGAEQPHREPDPEASGAVLPRLMIGSTAALVVLGLALTVVAGPLFDISTDAADDLLRRTPYVEAVFPDGAP